MGVEKLQIIFDLEPAIFYSGQTVSARIEVVNSTPIRMKGFYIKVKGGSEVRSRPIDPDKVPNYGNTATNDDRMTLRGYDSSEDYLNDQFAVFGWGSEGTLEPGEYSFPFNYTLPRNLPSSFLAKFGFVRYSLMAVMHRPWAFDHKAKAIFTVICPLDLNSFPQLLAPVTREFTKKFCCLCCASGPVKIVLSIPKGGAVPGETLLLSLQVENDSYVNLNRISLKFIKSVTYYANTPQNCTENLQLSILEQNLGHLEAGKSCTYERVALPIPPLPPSYLLHCNIIDLDYFVEAFFCPSGFRRNFNVQVPVVVGTIPLQQNFT